MSHGVTVSCFLVSICTIENKYTIHYNCLQEIAKVCFLFIPINIYNETSLVFLLYLWWWVSTIKRRHLEVKRPMWIFSKGLWPSFLKPDLHLPWTLLFLSTRTMDSKQWENIKIDLKFYDSGREIFLIEWNHHDNLL